MRFQDLLRDVEVLELKGDPSIAVQAVRDDSRAVKPGDVFVAVPGLKNDGHAHVAEALTRGAVALIAERDVAFPGPIALVAQPRVALARAVAVSLGRPADALQILGVTGTNGKTTTTWVLESILRAAGHKVALLGTIKNVIAGRDEPSELTTPGPAALHSVFRRAVGAGCSHAILEVSSHALDQSRVEGLRFAAAGFSNLTQDHLDLHGTMEAYAAAKSRLFSRHLRQDGVAVINRDSAAAVQMIEAALPRSVYSVSGAGDATADLYATRVRNTRDGLLVHAHTRKGPLLLESLLVGSFHVDNLLLAAGLALAVGVPLSTIETGVRNLAGVPGRLEAVPTNRDFSVFVDYAHTPDALERVLATLRPLTKGRILVVFGCGGDRDATKRPLMGRIVGSHAAHAIVTSDNPRTEAPERILEDIVRGIPTSASYEVISDRRRAIRTALAAARAGDIVLIAGKGHETVQIIGTTRHPFEDRREVLLALESSEREAST